MRDKILSPSHLFRSSYVRLSAGGDIAVCFLDTTGFSSSFFFNQGDFECLFCLLFLKSRFALFLLLFLGRLCSDETCLVKIAVATLSCSKAVVCIEVREG